MGGEIGEWKVKLSGTNVEGRACAIGKSEAIKKARRHIEHRAGKRQTKTKADTWEYAGYVAVFTTDLTTPAETILDWHRARWQIELTFKRLKSLAKLGHLPKYDDCSSRVWLYGKLLVALLTQKLIRIGPDISPWGYVFAPRTSTK